MLNVPSMRSRPGCSSKLVLLPFSPDLANRCAELTAVINALEKEIAQLVEKLAPALLALRVADR